jgi:hypothetical protein
MANYKMFKDIGTKFIRENGADLILNSAKEASDDNKSFIRTLGDNVAETAISEIATGLFGGEAVVLVEGAEAVMKGVDKVFQYGREKAQHEVLAGAVASGQLGNKLFNSSEIAATMRQRQLQNMSSDMQKSQAFGSEARKRAMKIAY